MHKTVSKENLTSMIERCSAFLKGDFPDHIKGVQDAAERLWRLYDIADAILKDAHDLGISNRDRLVRHFSWREKSEHKIFEDSYIRDLIMIPANNTYYSKSEKTYGQGRGLVGRENITQSFREAVRHVRNNAQRLLNGEVIPHKESQPNSIEWKAAAPLPKAA